MLTRAWLPSIWSKVRENPLNCIKILVLLIINFKPGLRTPNWSKAVESREMLKLLEARRSGSSLRRKPAALIRTATQRPVWEHADQTHPGVVSFCLQFSNLFFPLKQLLPAHVELFSKCCKLLENRTDAVKLPGLTQRQPRPGTRGDPPEKEVRPWAQTTDHLPQTACQAFNGAKLLWNN